MALPLPPPTPLKPDQVRVRTRVAKVGVVAAWIVVFLLVYANFDESVIGQDVSLFSLIAGTAFLASCALWIVMILEYVRERPAQYSLLWALLLFTGPVFGPLLFYYRVWRVRYRAHAF